MTDKVEIIGVKVGNKYYLSEVIQNSYHRRLVNCKINGEKTTPSFNQNWFISAGIPEKVELYRSAENINHRYELIDRSLASDKIPLVIDQGLIDLNDDYNWVGTYANLQSLYQLCYDKSEERYEEVEFTYETILEVEDIKYPDKVVYTGNARFNELAKILYPPVVLPNTRCELTIDESYRIIREYVKLNINQKYARITSDYDFCFTVKKIIELATIQEYKVDVNAFTKRRKPKYETRYRTTNEIECFEMAPKPYQNYTVIKPFSANNQKELEENIQKYLNDLIKRINEPLKYCKCCKGTGVILDN